jgi:hypothetical protein
MQKLASAVSKSIENEFNMRNYRLWSDETDYSERGWYISGKMAGGCLWLDVVVEGVPVKKIWILPSTQDSLY